MKIDIFSHILPESFLKKASELVPQARDIDEKGRRIYGVSNLDDRFRRMDEFGDYAQVINIVAPPIEAYGPPAVARDLARLANDSMAELVRRYPDRFVGFVAALPMNDPEGLLVEAERAVKELGASGVQVYTNVLGRPIDRPETMPIFDLMAQLDRPIWLHPVRGAEFSDYKDEAKSRYEIWWAFGWSYETSAAMAHLVFSGIFDKHPNLEIITHHMGGIVPYLEGKVSNGWDYLGTRTSDVDYKSVLKKLKRRPVDYFRMFYADTALFGGRSATVCGLDFFGVSHSLFGTDAPFGPENKWGYTKWTIEIIDSLDISEEDRKAIYEGNARRLLRQSA